MPKKTFCHALAALPRSGASDLWRAAHGTSYRLPVVARSVGNRSRGLTQKGKGAIMPWSQATQQRLSGIKGPILGADIVSSKKGMVKPAQMQCRTFQNLIVAPPSPILRGLKRRSKRGARVRYPKAQSPPALLVPEGTAGRPRSHPPRVRLPGAIRQGLLQSRGQRRRSFRRSTDR